MEFPDDIFKNILTFLKLGEKERLRLCLVLADLKLAPRLEEGDIQSSRFAFASNKHMGHFLDRLCDLKMNGAEERYTVRVVTKATRCFYRTVKVDMLKHPEIFEPIMDHVKTTEKDAQAPNLWHGYLPEIKVSMESGWFKVNKPALMAFIKTIHWKTADQCDQGECYKRTNYIQVVHNLKFNDTRQARIGISI